MRALRDQYVLREEAHRSELAEERQRLLLERQVWRPCGSSLPRHTVNQQRHVLCYLCFFFLFVCRVLLFDK